MEASEWFPKPSFLLFVLLLGEKSMSASEAGIFFLASPRKKLPRPLLRNIDFSLGAKVGAKKEYFGV